MDYRGIILGVIIGVVLMFGFIFAVGAPKEHLYKGINQGRLEIFTGQVICRQSPLQGTQIELECKTRKEIEDFLRFIQPQGNVK